MVEFFHLRAALEVVKKLGLELKEENFFELTEEDLALQKNLWVDKNFKSPHRGM